MQFSPRQQELPIGGVPVLFPLRPYPSQRAMMAKVIQALNQESNALLESPTGSGKSMALLCSSLAWQAQQRDGKMVATAPCTCSCHSSTDPVPVPCQNGIKTESTTGDQNGTESAAPDPTADDTVGGAVGVADSTDGGAVGVADSTDGGAVGVADSNVGGAVSVAEEDEDFRRPRKRYRTPGGMANSVSKRSCMVKSEEVKGDCVMGEDVRVGGGSWKMEVDTHSLSASQQPSVSDSAAPPPPPPPPPCDICQCASSAAKRRGGVPKVYFGTRTHQQISQITHELAKTAYSSTPMCILGSREHACIHPDVSKSHKKNDKCKKLLEEGECSFYYGVAKKLGSQAQLLQHGLTTAWDMEDLVTLGKRVRACPYFATRGIKEEAHIVFCPYNYLIDPLIRDQMLIELTGQVVVLDEAHNMEDAARDAASATLTSSQLEELAKELTDILDSYFGKLRGSFQFLAGIGVSVKRWMDKTVSSLPHDGFDQTCGIWSGQDFIPVLKDIGIIDSAPAMIKSHVKAIMDAVNEQKKKEEKGEQSEYVPCPTTAAVSLLKGLAMVLTYLFRDTHKFADDYRVSLMRSAVTKPVDDGWRRRRQQRVMEKVWLYSLNFWCLNPSVAFSELSCARSVVLTSGTLSPLSSFSSELGMEFKVQLEATHVVPETQTFIRSISCGPHGRSLCANYQNSESFEFQDEVGAVVERVCQVVPSGVLCFLSSYKMMNKLKQRWQATGLWGSIEQKKVIVTEPNGSNKIEFEAAMRQFYGAVEDSGDSGGALFLAVCRGKVSEGLDFSDHNARAVITVGIPFPSIKDKQVELKREYNNQYCRERGLLSGSEWYDIQAFRALNQALGRCIRHRGDWGALVLVDERFGKGVRYTRGLSKWIRQRLCHERNFSSAIRDLVSFSERMTAAPGTRDDSVLCCGANDSSTNCRLSPSLLSHPHTLSPSLLSHPHTRTTPLNHWKPPSTPVHLATPTTRVSQWKAFKYPGDPKTPPPAVGSEVKSELDDSVEITGVTVSLIDSPPHNLAPPTAATPTCSHSPLLFDSGGSSATPTLPLPPHSTEPVGVACSEVKEENVERAIPISPHPPVEDIRGCVSVGVVKAATPMRRKKANARIALRRGPDPLIGGCGQNGIVPADTKVRGIASCASCGQTISTEVMYERVSVHQMLVDPANPVELKTRLWTELGREAYLSSSWEQLSCREREEGVCNAVWDRKLRMCFGVVECLSGHMVGVRVHSAPLTNMVDKVLLSVVRTDISDI